MDNWMGWLRQQAGLTADWVPPDEAREKDAADEAGAEAVTPGHRRAPLT